MPDFESFEEWYDLTPENEHNIWDSIPGTEFLESDEREEAFQLFYTGFVDRDINSNERWDAREDFASFMYFDLDEHGNPIDFPWEEWREWMGYE
jgi:hypothetical protein